MRIDDNLPSRSVDKKAQRNQAKPGGGALATPFAAKLAATTKAPAELKAELEELKKELDLAGDSLEREPSMTNYKAFRELLTTMARKVSSEAYRIELLRGSPAAPAYHEAIAVIDAHADSLYRLVMSEQKDRIRIAAKIEEIRGLVLSFML